MSYTEVLEKIHEFNRFGSRLGLERMYKLLELLGNPHEGLKIIHIAGTNGKGSVSRYVYSVLQANGYRTGLYTSPFLERFTERIEFDGAEILEEDLIRIFSVVIEKVDEMVASGYDSPTEFELVTAMALYYFAAEKADLVVLEVGLGGSGDSTNVASEPLITAITSISYDHMEQLGDTLEKIASNKAGIIKPGVPVIAFVEDEGAKAVIAEEAAEKGSRLIEEKDISIYRIEREISGYSFDAQILDTRYDSVKLSMLGEHQVMNAACALCIIEYLKQEKNISMETIKIFEGMKKAFQKGRFEIVEGKPTVAIDGAHNIAGVKALVKTAKYHFGGKRILIVTGILKDKQVGEMTRELSSLDADFIVTEPYNPRKMNARDLEQYFLTNGKKTKAFPQIEDAWNYAQAVKDDYDVIICTGSLYLIGAIRHLVFEKSKASGI